MHSQEHGNKQPLYELLSAAKTTQNHLLSSPSLNLFTVRTVPQKTLSEFLKERDNTDPSYHNKLLFFLLIIL